MEDLYNFLLKKGFSFYKEKLQPQPHPVGLPNTHHRGSEAIIFTEKTGYNEHFLLSVINSDCVAHRCTFLLRVFQYTSRKYILRGLLSSLEMKPIFGEVR